MDKYEVIRMVGKGSYGKVYLVKHKLERKQYCLKCIKLENISQEEFQACKLEVKLLGSMIHPNIVGFKESFVTDEGRTLCIIMTFCDGGDLSERLKRQASKQRYLPEEQILHWFVQLALGLHFMHSMNNKCILHRDLKTQNIFLLGNGRLVIGDLGISKALQNGNDFTFTMVGTPYYMSPEVYQSKPYNHKSDVWALGCILHEIVSLKRAFEAKSLKALMDKVVSGRYTPIPSGYSIELNLLISKMLSINPKNRPSLPKILSLPFIKKHVYWFLHGIAQRPIHSLGDGTMVLRRAAMGDIKLKDHENNETMFDKQTRNLNRQLISFGMADIINQAFARRGLNRTKYDKILQNKKETKLKMSENNNLEKYPKVYGNEDPKCNHKKIQKNQCNDFNAINDEKIPLIIERERRYIAQIALEKLKKERLERSIQRKCYLERKAKKNDTEKMIDDINKEEALWIPSGNSYKIKKQENVSILSKPSLDVIPNISHFKYSRHNRIIF